MTLKGTIKAIQDRQSGKSKATGNEWQTQKISIGWDEPFDDQGHTQTQILIVRVRGEYVTRFAEAGYQVGDTISGQLRCYPQQHNGFWDNDLTFFPDPKQ